MEGAGSAPPRCTGREQLSPPWWMEPDGEAGGHGPPSREFDSPHSPWVCGPIINAAGRDGDLTGLIRPKISGQYGALRLGPGRSPRKVLSTIRVGASTRGPDHLAPVAQVEEAAGPNPACCTFESCRGYRAGDARVAERPLRTRERESSTLSTGSLVGPCPNLAHCLVVNMSSRYGKQRPCRSRSTRT